MNSGSRGLECSVMTWPSFAQRADILARRHDAIPPLSLPTVVAAMSHTHRVEGRQLAAKYAGQGKIARVTCTQLAISCPAAELARPTLITRGCCAPVAFPLLRLGLEVLRGVTESALATPATQSSKNHRLLPQSGRGCCRDIGLTPHAPTRAQLNSGPGAVKPGSTG